MFLSVVIFLPLLGAVALCFFNGKNSSAIKTFALLVAMANLILSTLLFVWFNPHNAGVQFEANTVWIPSWGANYHVGLDGISILLFVLTAFISCVAIISSWNYIKTRVKEYYILMLTLGCGMLGVFASLDLFLFYVFWEATLIPMYFLIGIWGGERRIYATIKFFLYTMLGSVLMLVAIMSLYFQYHAVTGVYTFDLMRLYELSLPVKAQLWMFAAFGLAMGIKVPVFPFHTWLPDAHVEAPTAGSVILAGILLKMGTYGFIRFCLPLFPDASVSFAPLISVLAIIGIIYGALMAMVQKDVKSLVAYSSVSHLGFVMLGIFAFNIQAMQGSLIQMVNHGLSTGALFLMVGMLYERRHTRLIDEFGGLTRVIPVFACFFMIVSLSSIGLPGLNGFVGEFLILVGTFRSNVAYAVVATGGIILSAVYMLWMYQRVMFGQVTNPENQRLVDLSVREFLVLFLPVIFIFWIGIYPGTFLGKTACSSEVVLKRVHSATHSVGGFHVESNFALGHDDHRP
jgi:NADH-quinone oxidoreductase subunit M